MTPVNELAEKIINHECTTLPCELCVALDIAYDRGHAAGWERGRSEGYISGIRGATKLGYEKAIDDVVFIVRDIGNASTGYRGCDSRYDEIAQKVTKLKEFQNGKD